MHAVPLVNVVQTGVVILYIREVYAELIAVEL